MVKIEKVWYCTNGQVPVAIVASGDGPVKCEDCGKDMIEIGVFESYVEEDLQQGGLPEAPPG